MLTDENGYPYNGMFPPTEDLLNGNDGYDSIGKGVFFYDYAVRVTTSISNTWASVMP